MAIARMHFTTTETGAMWGVSRATVQRMCRSGEVRGLRTPGGHWRIPHDEVERVRLEMEQAGEPTHTHEATATGDAATASAAQPTDPKRAARGDGGDEARRTGAPYSEPKVMAG